jgi:hypothetical protein
MMSRAALAALLATAVVGTAVVGTASGSVARTRGPFLLVSLPDLGTVTWRCDPAREPGPAPGLPGMALGFRATMLEATERLTLRVGRTTIISRLVQPGDRFRLPYLQARSQRLDITQSTEIGTLTGSVTVDFAPSPVVGYCYGYAPPRIDVHVSPRH